MNKITSVTIALNEANNIERCIKSLIGVADEIIVLIDNKTTDLTEKILASVPEVKYSLVEWQGFSKTKQLAIDMASNNWILWLDADEELSDELKAEINSIKNAVPDFQAYSIPRRAMFLGRWIYHSGWYPGYVTRLFDKTSVQLSDSAVHEHLLLKSCSGKLKSDLNHYTDPSIFHYFSKFNNYTTLAALDLNKYKKKYRISDLLIRPPFLFIKMYILKAGFLDGLQGFILSIFSSLYVFTKYAKLWEQQYKEKQNAL